MNRYNGDRWEMQVDSWTDYDPWASEDLILGEGAASFIPMVSGIGKIASGLLGGGSSDSSGGMTQLMTMQMLQQERDRKANEERERKAAESRARTWTYIGIGAAGLVGIGALAFLLKRK